MESILKRITSNIGDLLNPNSMTSHLKEHLDKLMLEVMKTKSASNERKIAMDILGNNLNRYSSRKVQNYNSFLGKVSKNYKFSMGEIREFADYVNNEYPITFARKKRNMNEHGAPSHVFKKINDSITYTSNCGIPGTASID